MGVSYKGGIKIFGGGLKTGKQPPAPLPVGPPIVSFATWNPADKHSNITLSDGDLTVFQTAGSGNIRSGVRATISRSSGKYYWETTTINQYLEPAVALSDWPVAGTTTLELFGTRIINGSTGSMSWVDSSDTTIDNFIAAPEGNINTPGDVHRTALDLDNEKIWFGVNEDWVARTGTPDPFAGTDPMFSGFGVDSWYPAILVQYFNGDHGNGTTNFGAQPFDFDVPAGFSAGFGTT